LGSAASLVADTCSGPSIPAPASEQASVLPRPGQRPAAQKAAKTGSGDVLS
jgi:hypothetical protein